MSAELAVSLTTLATIVSIFVTLTITKSYVDDLEKPYSILYITPELSLVILLALGILAMGVLSCLADETSYKDVRSHHRDEPAEQMWQLWLHRNLKLFGLVPFFFFSSFLTIAFLVAESRCIPVWNKLCPNGHNYFHYIEATLNVESIVFMLTATVFCWKFQRMQFVGHIVSSLGLAVLLATTLSYWFYSLFIESFYEPKSATNRTQPQDMITVCLHSHNQSFHPVTKTTADITNFTELEQCFNGTTYEFKFAKSANRFLQPFTAEFLTMLAECVASWLFISSKNRNLPPSPSVEISRPNSDADNSDDAVFSHSLPVTAAADSSPSSSDSSLLSGRRQSLSSSTSGLTTNDRQSHATACKYGAITSPDLDLTTDLREEVSRSTKAMNGMVPSASDNEASSLLTTSTRSTSTRSTETELSYNGSPRFFRTIRRSCRKFCGADTLYILSVIVFAIASINLLVASIIQLYTTDEYNYGSVERFRLSYWILLIVCNIVGVAVSWNSSRPPASEKSQSQSVLSVPETADVVTDRTSEVTEEGFEWFEWFIVVCQLGPMFRMSFSLIATVGDPESSKSLSDLFTAEDVIGFLQLFLQTPFYFYAKGVRFDFSRSRRDASCQLRKAMVFEAVLMCFVLSNLTLWIQDTFIMPLEVERTMQSKFYTNWKYIFNSFNPLSLMYSFNSTLLYISVCLEHKYRRTLTGMQTTKAETR